MLTLKYVKMIFLSDGMNINIHRGSCFSTSFSRQFNFRMQINDIPYVYSLFYGLYMCDFPFDQSYVHISLVSMSFIIFISKHLNIKN